MKQLHERITSWGDKTFGPPETRSPLGPLNHLIEEAYECIDKPDDGYEYADCLILIFQAAHLAGFEYDDLHDHVVAKMIINEARKYPPVEDQPKDQPVHRLGRGKE